MARTAITVQDIVAAGLTPTYEAGNATGHKFVNGGDVFLHVKNGGGGAVVVTCQTPFAQDGLALAERTVSIPAGEERCIGPFPPKSYNIQSGTDAGQVYVDLDVVTSVTIAAIRLP